MVWPRLAFSELIGTKSWVSHRLRKCSTTELHAPVLWLLLLLSSLERESHKIAQAGLDLVAGIIGLYSWAWISLDYREVMNQSIVHAAVFISNLFISSQEYIVHLFQIDGCFINTSSIYVDYTYV